MGFYTSCERALMPQNPANTPEQNFETLWNTVNDRYTYFNLRAVNWDSVYQVYKPRINNQMHDTTLFNTLSDMLFLLQDGHVNLTSDFDISRNWDWFLDYPENFSYALLERNYLGPDYKIAGGMRYTILSGNVGYIYYSSFNAGLSADNLDFIFSYLGQTKGLIFDIRNNGGGSLSNAYLLAERLFPQQTKTWLRQYKNGPGHTQFTPVSTLEIEAKANSELITYSQPTVFLTNRKTYSAANTLAAILSSSPNYLQVGDRTGGGGGIPADHELPNGWILRFSSTRDFTQNRLDFELGIPPTHAVELDTAQLLLGIDPIIETAKGLLQ
jgi:hypothetical protein